MNYKLWKGLAFAIVCSLPFYVLLFAVWKGLVR